MTQRERAEVAAKVFGVALLVLAVDALPVALGELHGSPARDARSVIWGQYFLWWPWALGLFGAFCIWKAQGLSRRLLSEDEQPTELPAKALRIGIAVMGGVFLMSLPNAALGLAVAAVAPGEMLWLHSGILAVWTTLAGLFAVRTDQVATFLKRFARGGPNSLPAAGVVLLGGFMCAGGLIRTAMWGLQAALGPVPDFASHVGGSIWWVTYLAESIAATAAALLTLRCADGITRWCAGPGEGKAGAPALKGLSGATVVTGALCIGMAWLLARHLDGAFGPAYWDRLDRPSLPLLALSLVAQVALVGVAFWGAGFSLPRLGQRLNGGSSRGESDGRNLAVFVEVGLAVAGLHYLFNLTSVALQQAYVAEHISASDLLVGGGLSLTAFAVPLTFLVFRADLVRLLVRGSGPAAEVPRVARAAALRPWLVLLGLYMLLRDVPMLIGWAAGRMATGWNLWTTQLPPPRLLFGFLLLFASAPLSRALSYGPILRRRLHPSADTL